MGCKCSELTSSPATKAAMCQTCPHANRTGVGVVGCTISGQHIETVVRTGFSCPAGRFNGTRVRWAGVEWLGVPEPLRWLLTWQLKREPRNLDGCGCIKAVKESRIGPWVETWFEGITLLRKRFGEFLTEFQVAMRGV